MGPLQTPRPWSCHSPSAESVRVRAHDAHYSRRAALRARQHGARQARGSEPRSESLAAAGLAGVCASWSAQPRRDLKAAKKAAAHALLSRWALSHPQPLELARPPGRARRAAWDFKLQREPFSLRARRGGGARVGRARDDRRRAAKRDGPGLRVDGAAHGQAVCEAGRGLGNDRAKDVRRRRARHRKAGVREKKDVLLLRAASEGNGENAGERDG